MKEASRPKQKMQVIETINCNGLLHNSILMNINFEISHYWWIPFPYANYSVNLMSFIQSLKAIVSIITWVEILALNNYYSILDLMVYTTVCKSVDFMHSKSILSYFWLIFQLNE